MSTGGPHIIAALICENVLTERDGVNSCIRIIDKVTIVAEGPQAPATMPLRILPIKIFLCLKNGKAQGNVTLEIRFIKPLGGSPKPDRRTLHFEGGEDKGQNLIINANVEVDEPGLYWFEFYLNNQLTTRTPFSVIYIPQPS